MSGSIGGTGADQNAGFCFGLVGVGGVRAGEGVARAGALLRGGETLMLGRPKQLEWTI